VIHALLELHQNRRCCLAQTGPVFKRLFCRHFDQASCRSTSSLLCPRPFPLDLCLVANLSYCSLRTKGVIGNKIVDQHAKEAAREPDGPKNPHNRHMRPAAATFVPKPLDQVEAACQIDLSRRHSWPTEGSQRCLAVSKNHDSVFRLLSPWQCAFQDIWQAAST
jgi:hypothetical protein